MRVQERGGWRKAVGGATGAVLALLGGLHMAWAATTWPFASEAEAARHLLGQESWVPGPVTLAMGGCLVGSAHLVLMVSGLWRPLCADWVYRLGVWGLAAALLARGFGGPLLNSGAAEEFVRWNWRLYSPLCVVLGACVLALAPRPLRDGSVPGSQIEPASRRRVPK